MRNTARLQVIALALFGVFTWMSFDVQDVRSAVADLLFPAVVEDSAPAPGFDVPVLGDETAHPTPEADALEIRVMRPTFHRHWVTKIRRPLVVG